MSQQPARVLNFIAGKFVAGRKDRWLDNYGPATGEVISAIVASTPEDVDDAVSYSPRGRSDFNSKCSSVPGGCSEASGSCLGGFDDC